MNNEPEEIQKEKSASNDIKTKIDVHTVNNMNNKDVTDVYNANNINYLNSMIGTIDNNNNNNSNSSSDISSSSGINNIDTRHSYNDSERDDQTPDSVQSNMEQFLQKNGLKNRFNSSSKYNTSNNSSVSGSIDNSAYTTNNNSSSNLLGRLRKTSDTVTFQQDYSSLTGEKDSNGLTKVNNAEKGNLRIDPIAPLSPLMKGLNTG